MLFGTNPRFFCMGWVAQPLAYLYFLPFSAESPCSYFLAARRQTGYIPLVKANKCKPLQSQHEDLTFVKMFKLRETPFAKGNSILNLEQYLLWWAHLNHVMGHGTDYPLLVSNELAADNPVSRTKQLAQWGMLILLICLWSSASFYYTRCKEIWSLLNAL